MLTKEEQEQREIFIGLRGGTGSVDRVPWIYFLKILGNLIHWN